MNFRERISTYDLHGPDADFQVASIAFYGFDLVRTYCVGYRLIGSNLSTTSSWIFDHANTRQNKDEASESISLAEISHVLKGFNMSVHDLLSIYCSLIATD